MPLLLCFRKQRAHKCISPLVDKKPAVALHRAQLMHRLGPLCSHVSAQQYKHPAQEWSACIKGRFMNHTCAAYLWQRTGISSTMHSWIIVFVFEIRRPDNISHTPSYPYSFRVVILSMKQFISSAAAWAATTQPHKWTGEKCTTYMQQTRHASVSDLPKTIAIAALSSSFNLHWGSRLSYQICCCIFQNQCPQLVTGNCW